MKANSDCAFDDEYLSESHHFLKENREEKIERLCILVSWVVTVYEYWTEISSKRELSPLYSDWYLITEDRITDPHDGQTWVLTVDIICSGSQAPMVS